jgi:hypothetical protein
MPYRIFRAAVLLILLIPTLLRGQDSPNATLEFYGSVQSASVTALVVNGQLVDADTAQINTPLVVGMVVRVQGTLAPDGRVIATQIDPVSPGLIPGIVEINGVIAELGGASLRIGGQTIDISSTQIIGTLTVGQPIRVYAVQTAPGAWAARLVIVSTVPPVAVTPEIAAPSSTGQVIAPVTTPEVIPPAQTPEIGEDFEIEGTVQAFDANTITVDGNIYFIGSARIEDQLFVGARVRLEIRVIRGGEWIVEEIDVRGGNPGRGGGDDD